MSSAKVPAIDQLQGLAPGTPPFSYAPQTWGWGVLLGLLVLAVLVWAVLRWRRWQRDRYRREALARLAWLEQQAGQQRTALRELPELIKRVALSMPSAPAVNALGGPHWQAFLQKQTAQPLPAQFAAQLQLLAYAPDAQLLALQGAEVQALLATCRHWIRDHVAV
ncbi:DUF4381 domain-containing protein [Pseudomonas sp. CM27]|uniref:DUF4381 domain-containing protein n=1 Tax=Pseudomonas sp. CM27 TaxID=2738452 RepID=UPI0015573366|nr:DUF4381 domain-containing protein [Pseudomonas sp. CM27]NQD74998.1 DUF4381 domain-containing protein [Pseudomonas sp. CM27]